MFSNRSKKKAAFDRACSQISFKNDNFSCQTEPAGQVIIHILMSLNFSPPRKNQAANRGFSLITVILVLALLVTLIAGLSSYLRIERAAASAGLRQTQAEQYAKLGLRSALLALQNTAGPDQRATANADILENCASENRYWTGVWDSTTGEFLQWLISSSDASGNPLLLTEESDAANDEVIQASKRTVQLLDVGSVFMADAVEAGVVSTEAPNSPFSGEFAWWVGDEGVKAKFLPVDSSNGTDETWKRLSASPRVAVETMTGGSNLVTLDETILSNPSIVVEQLQYLDESLAEFSRRRFHDLTPYSFGVLSDQKKGGLRGDLTHAFENDQVFDRELAQSQRTFYFLENDELHSWLQTTSFSNPGSAYTGPNWGNLRAYYQLKDEFMPGNPIDFTAVNLNQRLEVNAPYISSTATHQYTTNSPVFPIQTRVQVTIGVEFEKLSESVAEGVVEERFGPVLRLYPLVVLSNPYNVRLTTAGRHVTRWTLNPLLNFQIGSNPLVEFNLYETFVLEQRPNGGFEPVRPEARTHGTITLEPGESLIFGLEAMGSLSEGAVAADGVPTTLSMPKINDVTARGYYRLPLVSSHIHRATQRGASDLHSAADIATTPRFGLTAEEMEDLVVVRRTDTATGTLLNEDSVDIGILFGKFTMSWHNQVSPNSGLQRHDGLFGIFNDPSLQINEDGLFFYNVPLDGDHKLATWRFGMRTSMEENHPSRWIDGNFRATYFFPGYEARTQGQTQGIGSNMEGALPVSGYGNQRGVFRGNVWEMPGTSTGSYRAYWGPGISGATGAANANANDQTSIVLFDIPRQPLLSIAQLQHANIGHYSFHSMYPIGNSYLPPLLLRESGWRRLQAGGRTFPVIDHSHNINAAIWDSYFFSSLPQDAIETVFLNDLIDGKERLDNTRLRLYQPRGLRVTEDSLINADDPEVFRTVAGQLMIDGAFNVNSTSIEAWRAILSGLNNLEVPVYNASNEELVQTTESGEGVVISRFTTIFGGQDDFWTGFRRIPQSQINRLAEEIVNQVRQRGPFLTLGQFINRSLSSEDENGHSGALQSALDQTPGLNATSTLVSGAQPLQQYGDLFDNTPSGPQATGAPGHILQADLLQTIGPFLSARSDTFRIRAYGAVRNKTTGRIEAEAWCEAIVQRLPDPLGDFDNPQEFRQALVYPPRTQGRQFRIVGFRWLNPDEV